MYPLYDAFLYGVGIVAVVLFLVGFNGDKFVNRGEVDQESLKQRAVDGFLFVVLGTALVLWIAVMALCILSLLHFVKVI